MRVDGNDMYPIHRGAQCTVEAVTTALQMCEQGSRQTYVDMLRELIEADPHCYAICRKLVAGIANAPCEWVPAKFEENTADFDNAQMICDFVAHAVEGIPDWVTHKSNMLWGAITGVSCREIMWQTSPEGWLIASLEFIHTRRIAYDALFRPVFVDAFGNFSSIRPKDPAYRFKFWLFEAQLSDEYPTREGIGRVLVYWIAFKRFGAREFVGYVESRGKPLMDVSYNVGDRVANEKEVEDALALAEAWSAGSTGGGAHPSTIEAKLIGPGSGAGTASETPHLAFIKLCNEEESKGVLGGTLTTQEGDRGARSLGDTQKKGEEDLVCVLAKMFDGTIKRDIVSALVELNFGPEARKYIPSHHSQVEPPEDDELAMKTVGGLSDRGQPIPAQWVAKRFGIPLAQPGDMILSKDGAIKLMKSPEEMAEEAEAAQQAAEQANAPDEGDENEDETEAGEDTPAEEE